MASLARLNTTSIQLPTNQIIIYVKINIHEKVFSFAEIVKSFITTFIICLKNDVI